MVRTKRGFWLFDVRPDQPPFELAPEQAMVFANEESPFFMAGGFDAVAALYQTQPLIEQAFKSGGGVDWGGSCRVPVFRHRCDAATADPSTRTSWPFTAGVRRAGALAGIPGIGPIGATALVAEIGDWKTFSSGRSLAAWIGLVPSLRGGGNSGIIEGRLCIVT